MNAKNPADWVLAPGLPPFTHAPETVFTRMRDTLLALAALTLAAAYFYGARVLLAAAAGIAAAFACEALACLALRRPLRLHDGVWAVTGLTCALCLRAGAPFWAAAAAAAMGQIVWAITGGAGRCPVSPAVAGALAAALLGLSPAAAPLGEFPAGTVPAPGVLTLSAGQLLLGAGTGGMLGQCAPLVAVLGYLWLLSRGLARPVFSAAFLLPPAVLAISSAAAAPVGALGAFAWRVATGQALFAALYPGSDSVCAPMRQPAQALAGLLGGAIAAALTALFPALPGAYPGLLAANLLARPFDALFARLDARRLERLKK